MVFFLGKKEYIMVNKKVTCVAPINIAVIKYCKSMCIDFLGKKIKNDGAGGWRRTIKIIWLYNYIIKL